MNFLMLLAPLSIFLLITYFVVFRFSALLSQTPSHLVSLSIAVGILFFAMTTLFVAMYFGLEIVRNAMIYLLTFLFLLFFITLIFAVIFSLPMLKDKNILQLALIGIVFVVYV